MDVPNFDILSPQAGKTSGLLMGLDPTYQAKQADAAAAQLALKRATAFQNGVPTNPDGSIDIDSMARTQIQNGDSAGGLGLLTTGMKLALLRDPSTISNPTGQGSGGGLLSGATSAQPAAGGDSYGRQVGGGYAGVGQIGVGGAGGPAPAASQDGAGTSNSRGGDPTRGANPDVVGYIRSAFAARGINPNVALGVASAEGLRGFDPNGNANPGDNGSSFGPFQLHMGGLASGGNAVAGLGDDFAKATGLDPRDPGTWKQQVDFVADHVAQNGWGAFHGAKAAKIGDWQGIGNADAATGSPAPAGGQGSAPAGGSAPLISFGGPASSAPTSGASGDTPAGPAAGQAPVSDDMYATAKRVYGHFENADPRQMTLDQQRAVTMSTGIISRYEQEHGASDDTSPGTSGGQPASAASATPSTGQHPFFPPPRPQDAGAPVPAPGGLPTVTAGAQPGRQPPQAGGAPAMAPGGVQPISFGGGSPQAAPATGGAPAAPQAAPAAPVGAMPPEVAAALTRLQNRQGSPADAQLWGTYQRSVGQGVSAAVSGAGMAAPGSQPSGAVDKTAGNVVRQAMKDTSGPVGNVQGMQILSAAIPAPSASPDGVKGVSAFQQGSIDYQNARKQASDVNAFTANVTPATMVLRRLQQDQPAVFATTVAQLKQFPAGQAVLDAASQGMRYLATNGGGSPAGASPQGGQGSSAGPAPATGPDLPYLQGKYGAPGGGAQYVSDLLDQARKYGLAGEQQAAQAFETRAKQVQDDLAAINKSHLDLQTHNAELGDQQKLYRDAQGQGFQGTYLDFQNALATGKANAREHARLQADTDPSRISFAGAQAAATAAGTAQGSAPYKFVPTQPVPGGPTVYTSEADLAGGNGGTPAVKEQPTVFGDKQQALGKLDGEMQAQFQQRQVAQERLDAMSNLLETFQSGAGADTKAAAVAAVRAAGINIPDSATANPAAVEQFSKNATANVFQNAKDMGGRVLVSELDGLQKANANPNMQPASNAAILAQQKGLLNYEDAHYQDYSQWRQANPYATDASAFETAWAKAHPVGAYVTAAKKDIAPLGAPLPPQNQLSDGQAYIVKGQKVRWDAGSSSFVPFSGTTAPVLPGQASPGGGGQGRQPQGQGQAQGQGGTQAAPPVAGARQARDGNWYVPDPSRAGKFLMVAQ